MAFLICLEGIDQAGKKSITKIIVERLIKVGCEVEVISFPDYTTPIGREIRRFLRGERVYNPEVRQLLYVANRYERKYDVESWLNNGKIVIADRYTPSGLGYGLANYLDLEWMLDLERGLPEADITIIIDVPVDVAYLRRKKKDIYERDLEYQKKVRAAYLALAKKFNWIMVNGDNTLDEVVDKVWVTVLKNINLK